MYIISNNTCKKRPLKLKPTLLLPTLPGYAHHSLYCRQTEHARTDLLHSSTITISLQVKLRSITVKRVLLTCIPSQTSSSTPDSPNIEVEPNHTDVSKASSLSQHQQQKKRAAQRISVPRDTLQRRIHMRTFFVSTKKNIKIH